MSGVLDRAWNFTPFLLFSASWSSCSTFWEVESKHVLHLKPLLCNLGSRAWQGKQDPYVCCLPETHFGLKDTHGLKAKGWKRIYHGNGNEKQSGVAILTPDKTEFKTKAITIDKEGPSNLISGYLFDENENITLKGHVHPYVHCGIIYNS
uniref:Uncharacterized protein n=1 Tax=Rousettus aegyptiacus TaxID=9407 RepID=A0A7J8F174_ROUAE|nr:hypothetical protein HJG63_012231 [Rousettus aegyptiacus]